jgi:aspartate/methionine/tyrosine aminotransferase
VLKERRDVAVRALNDIEGVSCYSPDATFYLFPDVTGAMERSGLTDYADFRVGALEATGCSFCTRLHFGRELPGEDRRFVRIAYSGIDADRIATGLSRLKAFVERRSL